MRQQQAAAVAAAAACCGSNTQVNDWQHCRWHTSRHSRCAAVHCHLPAATHNVRSHWMSPADGPASPSCTRAMPQAVAVAYTASTLGAAARCSKSTSFLPLMPLSRLAARHSRMLSRSYGWRVCGAVACVWPVLTRLLSVSCPGHKNSHTGSGSGASKSRNRQINVTTCATQGCTR